MRNLFLRRCYYNIVKIIATSLIALWFSESLPAAAEDLPTPIILKKDTPSHRLSSKKPLPFSLPNISLSLGMSPEEDMRYPISRVFRNSVSGEAYYSSDVNRITCAVRNGKEGWVLGTRVGVKVVDVAHDSVRHYTRRDGLPGAYIEAIAADGNDLWAAVRVDSDSQTPGMNRIALCVFTSATQRWSVLGEMKTLSSRFPRGNFWTDLSRNSKLGKSYLAVTKEAVVFSPSVIDWDMPSFLFVYERKSRKLREVPWDAGLRADNQFVTVSFLACSPDDGTIWLGTSVGLLSPGTVRSVDISLAGKKKSWRRYLPDQQIDAGALVSCKSEKRKFLWLAMHERSRPDYLANDRDLSAFRQRTIASARWKLLRFDLEKGTAWPASPTMPPLSPLPPMPPLQNSNMEPNRIAADYLQQFPYPSKMTLSLDGTVWIVAYSGHEPQRRPATRISQYNPRTHQWSSLVLPGMKIDSQISSAEFAALKIAIDKMPDDVVLPLALATGVSENINWPNSSSYTGNRETTEDRNQPRAPLYYSAFWVRRRFPEWCCSNDIKETPIQFRHVGSERPLITDPAAPGDFWTTDEGDSVVLVSATDAPPERLAKSVPTYWDFDFSTPPPLPASAQRFLLPEEQLLEMTAVNYPAWEKELHSLRSRSATRLPSCMLDHLVVDEQAVWGYVNLFGSNSQKPSAIFRFDKTAHTWRLYGPSQGLPIKGRGRVQRLWTTGKELWLLHDTGLYRLDAENPKFVLTEPEGAIYGQPISILADLSDPDNIWVLYQNYRPPVNGLKPLQTPLARYSRSTKRMSVLSLPNNLKYLAASGSELQAFLGEAILSEPGLLWVETNIGLFQITEQGKNWKSVTLPLGVLPFRETAIFRDKTGRLWLWGMEEVVALKKQH